MGREDEIRMIAYALWVQDGHRRGKALEHWLRAEYIWEQNQKIIAKPISPWERPTKTAAGAVLSGVN